MRVRERALDALRDRLLVVLEPAVDRADDEVEALERLVRQVHAPVGQDVALHGAQDADLRVLLLDRGDRLRLLREAGPVEAPKEGLDLRVVAHADVLVAQRLGPGDHHLEGVVAVGPVRVHVEIAADVVERHEIREVPLEGRLDLAPVLPDLGRDPRQAHGLVDVLLLLARDALVVLLADDAVLVDREPLLLREAAELDVVLLGAREVLERGAEALARDDAEVDLELLLPEEGARFRLALPEDLADVGEGGEEVHHLLGLPGDDEDVDVLDRLLHAADAAGEGDLLGLELRLELLDEGARERKGDAERPALTPLLGALDRREDVLLGLLAHLGQAADLPLAAGRLELGDRRDVELLVEELRGLGADVLQGHDVQEAGGVLLLEVLEGGALPGLDELLELLGDPLADARDVAELVLAGEGGDVLGEALEGLGDVVVRADLERVVPLHLEELPELAEGAREVVIRHAEDSLSPPANRDNVRSLLELEDGLSGFARAC